MESTTVRQHPVVPVLVGVVVLAVGVGLGFALPPVARWLADVLGHTPIPTPGVVRFLGALTPEWSVGILGVLGLVAAVWIALVSAHEALRLTVSDDHLEYRIKDDEGWLERSDVAAAYQDGSVLVLLGHDDRPRARLESEDVSKKELRAALTAHGYPFRDEDPHEADYVQWVDGRPGFTDADHALLRRRWRERGNAEVREELDAELAAQGLVVRTRDDRLQVRHVSDAGQPGVDRR